MATTNTKSGRKSARKRGSTSSSTQPNPDSDGPTEPAPTNPHQAPSDPVQDTADTTTAELEKIEHKAAAGVSCLEDLPVGTTVEFRTGGEVVIHAAIAGGSRKTFHGSSAEIALAAYNKFVTIGPDILPGAGPAITQENLDKAAEEAHQRSLEDLKARGKEAD